MSREDRWDRGRRESYGRWRVDQPRVDRYTGEIVRDEGHSQDTHCYSSRDHHGHEDRYQDSHQYMYDYGDYHQDS